MKPILGVTLDANHVWTDADLFRAYCRTWKRLGVTHALLLSGSIHRIETLLPVARAEGIRLTVGGQEEIQPFLSGDGNATQAEADARVAPVAAILAQYRDVVEAVYVDDEPEAVRIPRLLLVADAYRRLLPNVRLTAALPGVNRGDLVQQAVGFDVLTVPVYPCTSGAGEGQFTIGEAYVRAIQAGAGEPKDGPHAPLWIIGQGHAAPALSLRYPSVSEIRQQFMEAWKLGAERFYLFSWDSQAVRDPVTHEITGYTYHGINERADLQQAIAEIDGHAGVPSVAVDYTQPVEGWWHRHPFNPEGEDYRPEIRIPLGAVEVDAADHGGNLWAAIQALPPSGGVVWLGDGTYNAAEVYSGNFAGFARNRVQIRAKPGAAPKLSGILRLIPVHEARDYLTWSQMTHFDQVTNTGVSARTVIRDRKLTGWYFQGLTFDGGGTLFQNVSLSTCADMVFEDCTFQGIVHPGNTTHPGHVTGNSALDGIWFRRCWFRGREPYTVGNLPWLAVYLDGLHGGGVIGCNFADGAFTKEDLLWMTNDDFSRDYDGDGAIPVAEWRVASHVISYASQGGSNFKHLDVAGREWLVDRLRKDGIYSWSAVWSDSKSNNVDNAPIPKWQYQFTGGVLKRAEVAGLGSTAYLLRQSAQPKAPYSGTQDPIIGRHAVVGNIVRQDGFSRWVQTEGANPAGHVGPNVVADNTTSGTIPLPLAWAPDLYPYLDPSAEESPPPPSDDCAEHEARIAALEAEVWALADARDALESAVNLLTDERDQLVAWQAGLKATWANLRAGLE